MKQFSKALSYIAVAVCASVLTLTLSGGIRPETRSSYTKLAEIQNKIDKYFIEDVDMEELEDSAAAAMIAATGDRWSYYVPADEYESYLEQSRNAYVGVGITIQKQEDSGNFEIMTVTEGAPAEEAGLRAGDLITAVEGTASSELNINDAKNLVRGKEGTRVTFKLLRGDTEMELSVTRRKFETPVATYALLESGYGYIRIENFESRCAKETIEAVDALTAQGAKGLIFDVRFNPGGYKDELVEVLDYLLPEGVLFRAQDYSGRESTDSSDASCVELPMAVLVNKDSYSAAEFFAAALQEYGWAKVVGEQTCGKGYFQNTFPLSDGSAVAISTGKYFTPQGKSLIGTGILPDVPVAVDEETYLKIYYGTLEREEDVQLQTAISTLNSAQ